MMTEVEMLDAERWTTALGGAALAFYGIRQRSVVGTLLAAGGGALMVRAAMSFTNAKDSDTRRALGGSRGVLVDESVTIGCHHDELYGFWRDLENLPRFMDHLVSVRVLDSRRSHWVAKAPAGRTVEWDAEIINDEPNELIAWRTLDQADVISAGSVAFKPTGKADETMVHVRLQYEPPAGKIGAAVARMLGTEPAHTIREDLRRFKSLMEAGEIPTTVGQPRGRQSILNYD
jgi:uncharacterized membrane protein